MISLVIGPCGIPGCCAMQTVAFIVLCFLGAWLLLYLDHRAKFVELFSNIPGLIFAMMISGFLLLIVYKVLGLAFHPKAPCLNRLPG